jgi:carboxyl-terminal processing protease
MKWLYFAALAALLQGCGGGSGDAPVTAVDAQACSIATQRQTLRDFMQTHYYWDANLRAPDESATSMDAYFQSMLYRPLDRYSFTQSTAEYNQVFTDGRRIGYGYTLVWGDASHTSVRVRNVEPASPVARAGLRRGDNVLQIDGFTPPEIAAGLVPTVSAPGIPRILLVSTAAGELKEIRAVSEDFPLQPVLATNVFDVQRPSGQVKAAYLAYDQFVGYSLPALQDAFAQFAAAGAGEIILDLRYNGGGSVNTSRDLASMVGGAATVNRVYAQLRFNDQQTAQSQSVRFNLPTTTDGTPLANRFPRLLVIASGSTASASELVINGLRPFMNVVLVGDTTYGKPYGFVPRDSCGITYQAVQFETINSLGVGGYTAGFTPDCAVADDLDHQLGDPQEARIATALNYIATGNCGPQRQALKQVPATSAPIGERSMPGMFWD